MQDRYTRYPRPILWLIRGGALLSFDVPSFYISKAPVTNLQFEAFDPEFRRSTQSPGDRDAAAGVTGSEAQAYCDWYARVSRKPMRLPSEIEWEYACRAGSVGEYFWGDDPAQGEPYLWDAGNSGGRLESWEAKRPNPFGLYGMLGGVWEWTGPPAAPHRTAPPPDSAPLRGGSFLEDRTRCSCAARRIEPVARRIPDAGFRIARSLNRPGDQ